MTRFKALGFMVDPFELDADLEGLPRPPKPIRWDYGVVARVVSLLYLQELRELGVTRDPDVWKISVYAADNAPDREVDRGPLALGVATVNLNRAWRPYTECGSVRDKHLLVLEDLSEAVLLVAERFGWPLEPFKDAAAKVAQSDFVFDWVGRWHSNRSRSLRARGIGRLDPEPRCWLEVRDKHDNLVHTTDPERLTVVGDLPDRFNKVTWISNDVVEVTPRGFRGMLPPDYPVLRVTVDLPPTPP